jgi:hypothetical protein
MPARVTNWALAHCFAGERHKLVRLALGESTVPYRRGVSLIALVQREGGPIEPRDRPLDVAGDYYDPAAQLVTADL